MYTSLRIVKTQPYAWIYYPNGLSTGFAVSKGYFTSEEETGLFQIVEQGKTKRPAVHIGNITLEDVSTGGPVLYFSSLSDLQQKLTELGNPLTQSPSSNILTGDEILAIQNSNNPSNANPFVTIDDMTELGVLEDCVLVSTGYTITSTDITFNPGWVWRINSIEYTNPIAVTKPIPASAAGLSRFDKFVGNTSNTFLRISGDEAASNIDEPEILPNTVQICMVLVTDSTVTETTPPITGNKAYVEKLESQDFIVNSGTTTIFEQINLVDERSSVSLTGSVTDVKSVQLHKKYIRPGKPHFIKNRSGHDIKLWHLSGTGNIKYSFPNSIDFIVKPNEVIEFNTNANDSNNVKFEFVGRADYYTKSEIDAKLSGAYIFKGNKTDYTDLVATGEHVNGYVYNLLDTSKNYAWNGTDWDDIGGTFDISGKEDIANKTDDIETNKTSSVFYTSAKAILLWINTYLFGNITAKATPLVDNDLILTGDSEDSFKTKTRTFSQLLVTLGTRLLVYFQPVDSQIEIGASGNVQNSWHGQTVLFTANCTITVPSTLNNSLMFAFRTLTGVTVTWAITAPFTWETTPGTTTEKTVGHFMRRGSTNTIMLDM